MSSDFVNASLLQLQAAAQLPSGSISETATNAALALIEAAAPRDEIEPRLDRTTHGSQPRVFLPADIQRKPDFAPLVIADFESVPDDVVQQSNARRRLSTEIQPRPTQPLT
jgi:hypothetical protein